MKLLPPARGTESHRILLRNISDSTDDILGNSSYSLTPNGSVSVSKLKGLVDLSAEKVFEIQHFTESAQANYGLGQPAKDAKVEIYTQVFIQKIA